ncbi:MAG: MFS transporter [Chloroflexi bacterium]|nr:MFS transporter [Chloroflexota bacterium]
MNLRRFRPSGLWRQETFLKLWVSQTFTHAGFQVQFLAVPLTAALLLDATPLQMGILASFGGAPAIVVGVFAGIWIDRRSKRSVLIAAAWGYVLAFLVVAVAAWFGFLTISLLFAVAFALGGLRFVVDVTYRAFLPSLVQRAQLVEANSKLEVGRSATEIGGPGFTGVLVQAVSAPFALAMGAAAYAVSALSLHRMRPPTDVSPRATALSVRGELREGLAFVMKNPVLRALTIAAAMVGGTNAALDAVGLLYFVHDLDLTPGLIGLVFSIAGVGWLVAASLAKQTTRRGGLGRSAAVGVFLMGAADVIIALAGGPPAALLAMVGGATFLFGAGLVTYIIGRTSLQQSMTPDRLQGRVNVVLRVAFLGAIPLGALAGGALGETIGLRPTLFIGAGGELLTGAFLLRSAVGAVRELPPVRE